jgi:hypothetical protein
MYDMIINTQSTVFVDSEQVAWLHEIGMMSQEKPIGLFRGMLY